MFKSTTSTANFDQDFAGGSKAEDYIESLLKNVGAQYTRNDLLPRDHEDFWSSWRAQNKGDFSLDKTGVYLEVKTDLRALDYGNIFFELGEIIEEDKGNYIRIVGPLKHLFAPTVFVHKVGVGRDSFWMVYTTADFYEYATSKRRMECKVFDDSKDTGFSKKKHRVFFLMKGFLKRFDDPSFRRVFTITRSEEDLIDAIREKAARAKREFEEQDFSTDIFWDVIASSNVQWNSDWNDYPISFAGQPRSKRF